MRWPAGSSGRRRPLPVSLGGDRRQDDGHRARPPGGERCGAPLGLTPGPDVAAAGQGHAEAPDQRDPVTDEISLASPVTSPEKLRTE